MSEELGKTIAGFQLVENIDESGSTLVYKGFQPSMNRYVAVKVLKPHLARDANAVQRFLQQSEIIAKLQHPNILPVYESGQEAGLVYRASRFVETGTLRDRLTEFYNPQQALGLVSGLTEALELIHSQGYVHGNLKPSNIFLDQEGRPLLTDFGQTQAPGDNLSPYMSPEQVQGGIVDRRTDIYTLGVLLYEMLVGQPPPAGAVVSAHAQRPDLPEAVDRVIFKAMAQNPDQRFQTVSEFRNGLDSALRPVAPLPQPTPVPTPTPAVSQSVQVEQPKGANWVAIVLGVTLVCILCVGAAFAAYWLWDSQGAEPTPLPPEVQPTQPVPEAPTQGSRPTRDRPTQPPEQPPTQPPPPTEEPPIEPPPEGQPTEPPVSPELPDQGLPDLPICSSAGFAGGAIFLGAIFASRKRRTFR